MATGSRAPTITPEPGVWPGLIRLHAARGLSAEVREFREVLGLPTDRPIVMTGHQAAFWHPGILAKYLAADAAAEKTGAAVAWVVVDQDVPVTPQVEFPVRREGKEGGGGKLERMSAVLPLDRAGRAVAEGSGLEFVTRGLERVSGAVEKAAGTGGGMTRVMTEATRELLSPLRRGSPEPVVVYATELARTGLFRRLVEAMAADPERCTRAYNRAAAAEPGAGVRALRADEVQDRWELPLWKMEGDGEARERTHVYAEDVGRVAMESLAPKALFMTALLRMAGCDLFIHGTGGGVYDRVMEDWLRGWGAGGGLVDVAGLAPAAVVTATRTLPLEVVAPEESAERAAWRAHAAMHRPELVGDEMAAREKARLLERVRSAAPGAERLAAFREMHKVLADFRAARGAELDVLVRIARDAREAAGQREIAEDRTWPFVIYPEAELEELRAEVRGAIGVR